MHIKRLQLKNFRCFSQNSFDFSAPITLIQGDNGSGKTSLLEALYYLCYLRSFRAHNTRDLIALGSKEFFIKALFADSMLDDHELQIGFSGQKKMVKLDQRTIESFKELMDFYRVVSLFEDDLELIKDGPEKRRNFIDYALLLLDPSLLATFRDYKKILDNRNALLQQSYGRKIVDPSYRVWTEQLWQMSTNIQALRIELLRQFQDSANSMLKDYFNDELAIILEYAPKNGVVGEDFDSFSRRLDALMEQEVRFGRSLFGVHLDDFLISFNDKQSRFYASRGQQKLTIVVLKVALLERLTLQRGKTVFLLDDFMTDFDENRAQTIVTLLSGLNTQLIFTSPVKEGFLERFLVNLGAERCVLKR